MRGREVAEAAIVSGRAVLAVADDAAALRALRADHPRADLSTLVAPLADDADAAALAASIRSLGRPLQAVVAAIGGQGACGRLVDQPEDVLRRTLDEDLLPHLVAARHLLPLLPSTDRVGYLMLGGPGAGYPWAGYGHRSIAAAALRMLARVLHEEARRAGVRVLLLSIDVPAAGCEGQPEVQVGRAVLELLARDASTGGMPAVIDYPGAGHRAADRPTRTSGFGAINFPDPTGPAASPDPSLPPHHLSAARRLLKALLSLPHQGPHHDERS